MNQLIYVFLIGLTLFNAAPVFAQEGVDPAARTDTDRAINITLSSAGNREFMVNVDRRRGS